MADVAISYAHSANTEAVALRNHLLSSGITVWMDEPSEQNTVEIGIPVGQAHWEVIEREFAAALHVAVVDTPDWRQRDYCQREYRRCRELGKPINFIDPDDMPDGAEPIMLSLREQRDALEAHARLASRVVAPNRHSSSWLRRVSSERTATDAQRVLTAQGVPFTVTPLIRRLTDDDVERSIKTRRQLRRVATSALTGFTVLAVMASGAWFLGSMWSRTAAEARDRAVSTELVAQSYAAAGTVEAVGLAQQAMSLNPDPRSREALQAAERRDGRTRVIEIPPYKYLGASWSADEPLVYVYSRNAVAMVGAENGVTKQAVELDHKIRSGSLVANSSLGVLYVDTSGALRTLDLETEESTVLGEGFSTIALSADGTLIGSGREGSLFTMTMSEGEALRGPSLELPDHARSIDIDGDTIAAVDDGGWLREVVLTTDGLEEIDSIQVDEGSLSTSTSWLRSTITICEDSIVGSFVPSLRGVRFAWDRRNSTLETAPALQLTAPTCSGEGALTTNIVRGDVEELFGEHTIQLPSDVEQVRSVRDPLHRRIAYVSSQPGRLLIINRSSAITERDLGVVTAVLPLDRATLSVGEGNQIEDMSSGESHGELPSPPSLWAQQGCAALIATLDGIHHVSCDTTAREISDENDFKGLHAAANGEDFVVTRGHGIEILSNDGEVQQHIDLGWLGNDPAIEADLSSDGKRVTFITVRGSVFEVPVSATGTQKPFTTVPGGNMSLVSYLPDGTGLVIVGVDGRARLYTTDGKLLATRQLGFHPDELLVDGDLLLATSLGEGSTILYVNTLGLVERFERGSLLPSTGAVAERFALAVHGDNSGEVTSSIWLTIPPVEALILSEGEDSAKTPTSRPEEPDTKSLPVGSAPVLQFSGVGQIELGQTAGHLSAAGAAAEDMCGWGPSPNLLNQGISLGFDADDKLIEITAVDDQTPTEEGARVGMTMRTVADIYGDGFAIETKEGNGGPFEAGVVRWQGREMVFVPSWEEDGLDVRTVGSITVREYSTDMYGGC